MSGINSAMLAGVTGLSANSAALAAISDDIANVNTVGYKANNTQFSDLVTNTSGSGYASGGVQAISSQDITAQGVMQAASSPTNMAISGNGFFVTTQTAATPSTTNGPYYTQAGAFTSNSQGYLVNSAGLYLQGWIADANGNITTNPSNMALLQPINVSQISSDPVPTTQAGVDANLNSNQTVSQASTDAGALTTYATNGAADAAAIATYATNGAADAATIAAYPSISSPTGAQTTAYNTAVAETAANTAAVAETNAYNTAVTNNDAYSSTSATTSMAAYTASGGTTGTEPDFTIQIPISNSEGGTQTVQLDLLKSTTANQWYAEVVTVPASSVAVGSGLLPGQIATGTIAFTDTGSLDTTSGATTLPLSLAFGASSSGTPSSSTGVNWASSLGLANQTVSLGLSGLTQDNSTSLLTSVATNGTPTGSLSSVQVSSSGLVTGVFSNGVSRTIAQVAIATFANPNGLTATNGDAYQTSLASGTYNLEVPGTGGAGTIESSELESSTVDLSSEFTNMITVQRAYSASSKIITTADEMLQDLISIIR
jgi:flagellar hook protein FlgE